MEAMGNPHLSLKLPLPVALGVFRHSVTLVSVPSPFHVRVPGPQWLKIYMKHLRDFMESAQPEPHTSPFFLQESEELADALRSFYHNPGLHFSAAERSVLHQWICKLNLASESSVVLPKKFHPDQIFRLMLLTRHLRNASTKLHHVVETVVQTLLPESQAKHMRSQVELQCRKQPLKCLADISRTRLYMDVGFMLWTRCQNYPPRESYCRYLHWDSSPQYGRDYELATVKSILRSFLPELLETVHGMRSTWSKWLSEIRDQKLDLEGDFEFSIFKLENPGNFNQMKEEEKKLMEDCKQYIHVLTMPATQVGFGGSGFSSKLRALLHAFRLNHFTQASLLEYLAEFVTSTEDFGTEKQISRLKPIGLDLVCPYFEDMAQDEIDMLLAEVLPSKVQQLAMDERDDPDDDLFENPDHVLGDSEPKEDDLSENPDHVLGNCEPKEDDLFENPDHVLGNSEPKEDDLFENPDHVLGNCEPKEDDLFENPDHVLGNSEPKEDDLFENPDHVLGDSQPAVLNIGHWLSTPPMHHINDTITTGLGDVMPSWDDTVHKSEQICKVVRSTRHKKRLLGNCFSSGLALHFQPTLKCFKGWIHTKRWATVAFSIPELRKIERAMRFRSNGCGWSKTRFQGGGDGTQKEDTMKLATDVDDAVQSPLYWAYLVVMDHMAEFFRKATTFAEVCPCHGRFLMGLDHVPEAVLKEMKPQWEKCPFRGMMLAELSEEFFHLLGQWSTASSAELLAKLPHDIEADTRNQCLRECEAGQQHIIFAYVLKLSHLHNSPYTLFRMAHLNTEVAWKAGDECLASASQHPKIRRLQASPLKEQFLRWRAGEATLFAMPELCSFIAELRSIRGLSSWESLSVSLCVCV
jgi:hypothetical protein